MNPTVIVGILFLVSMLFSLLLQTKNGWFPSGKLNVSKTQLNAFVVFLVFAGSVFIFRTFLPGEKLWINLLYFVVAFALPFLFRRLNVSNRLLGLVLFFASVAGTFTLYDSWSVEAFSSALIGLLTYKLTDNLYFDSDNSFDDLLPSCIWLIGLLWAHLTGKDGSQIQNILLSCMSISLLLKCIPPSAIANDRFCIKRLALSASAGLAFLIILTKILLLSKAGILAVLFGAGIFCAYFFENRASGNDMNTNFLHSTTFLIVIGILTLTATRTVGDLGMIVLCSAGVLCSGTSVFMFAVLFWLSRQLIQAFVPLYVANVTGINLMHSYCNIALYLGFLVIFALGVLLQSAAKKEAITTLFLLAGFAIMPGFMYFIHEEPTASFLIASNIAAILLFAFSPLLFKNETSQRSGNLLLIPMTMAAIGLLYGPLVAMGNEASVANRFQIIFGLTVALIIGILSYFIVRTNLISIPRNKS